MIAVLALEPLELWWVRRTRPELRDVPLVAAARGRVLHADPLARRHGVVPGMALAGARLRCAGLQVVEQAEAELQAAWESVLRDLHGLTPFLDGSRRGRAFLAVSAAEGRMLAEAYDAPAGVAAGREIAELAALATLPGRCRVLPAGSEGAFLDRLPLRFLRGVGLSGYSLQRLGWLGLTTAGELAGWRPAQLRAFLGSEAKALLPYLHGPWGERLPAVEPPATLRRSIRFDEPLFEPGPLHAAVEALAGALEEALDGRVAGRLTLAAEVGGVESRATRFAKKPLRVARDISLLARLALAETGAAPVGVEALTLEIPEPVRLGLQGRLWPARERREAAWEELLERFPQAAVEVEWLDPWAESSDLAWRWRRPAGGDGDPVAPSPLDEPAGGAGATTRGATVGPTTASSATPSLPAAIPAGADRGPATRGAAIPGAVSPAPGSPAETPQTAGPQAAAVTAPGLRTGEVDREAAEPARAGGPRGRQAPAGELAFGRR